MADESLNIEIKASAQQASASIDTLVKKLDKLSSVLNGVKGNGLQKFASGMSMLSNSMQKFQNVNAASFNRVAKGIKKFEDIDGSKISSVANGLNPLANSIQTLGNISFNSRNLSSAINSITRLSNANLSNVNSADFVRVGQAITNLSSTLSSAQEVSKNTIAMTVAIARLGSAGQSVNAVTAALPNLSAKLRDFINTMSTANTVDEKIISFTTAIGTLASAGSKTRTTVLNLDALASKLKDFMSTMRTAPNVSENTIRMTQALAQLASTGAYSGRTINSLRNAMSSSVSANGQYSNSLKRITASLKELNAHVKNGFGNVTSFTKKITSAIGIVGGLYGAIQGLRKSMDISSDLVEVQNVIDNTFAQYKKGIEDFSKTSITDYGMSELTAKTMAGRFQAMGTAAGIARKQMADMSVSITGLAADMASFYNMGQEDVATSLQAIFTGETEPLRRFGLDLTQATLQEWALKNGLDADMRSMTAAQKIMLRYQYVMANTSEVQGDFARTSDSWANSVRILKQQFEQLAIIIGGVFVNAFKPAVAAMNGFMTSVLNFAQTVADALGSIFGWTIDIQNVKIIDEATTSAETASAGIADNTKKAADNAKKLNKQLAKFDELNLFTTSEGTDSDSGKGKNGTPASGIGASGTPKLVETENISKKIKSGIKDFEELGKYVGESLAKALDKIKWNDIKDKAKKIGEEVGNLINGFISVPNLGSKIGKAIANSIDTAVTGLDAFFKKVHWNEVGEFIADGVNSIFTSDLLPDAASLLADSLNAAFQTIDGFQKKFKWKKAGETICKSFNKFFKKWDAKKAGLSVAGLVSGIATTVYTVVADKKTWSKLGQKVADGINGFFKGMNKVNKDTGLTGWQTLGKNISSTISGIATSITTALNETDWLTVGQSIGDFIGSIDWGQVVFDLAKLTRALLKAVKDAIAGMFQTNAIATTITLTLAYFKLKKGWSKLLTEFLTNSVNGQKLAIGVKNATVTIKKWLVEKAGKSSIIQTISSKLGISAGAINLGTIIPHLKIGAAVIAGAVAFGLAMKQLADKRINESLRGFRKRLAKINETSDEMGAKIENIRSSMDSIKGLKLSLGAETEDTAEIQTLADTVYKLSKNQKLSANGAKLLKESSQKLADKIPDWNKLINKNTGAYKGTKEQLDKLVNKTKEYYKLQAAQEKLKGIYKNQTDVEINLPELKRNLEKAKKEMEKAKTEQQNAIENSKKNTDSMGRPTGKSISEMETASRKVKETTEAYNKAKKKLDLANKTLSDLGKQEKIVSDYIEQKVKYTTDTKEIDKANQKIGPKHKQVSVGYKGKQDKDFEKTYKIYDKTKNKTITVTVKVKGEYDKLVNMLKNPLLSDKGRNQKVNQAVFNKKIPESVGNILKNPFGKNKNPFGKNKNPSGKNKNPSGKNKNPFGKNKKAKGGIYKNNIWKQVNKYAAGGLPNMGQMFIAREKGPELVGNLGGHTGVVNNEQIVSSVAEGVSDAVLNALAPSLTAVANAINGLSVGNGNGETVVTLDGKEIARAVKTQDTAYKKRTGKSLFA